jgi:hypothetical protein
MFSVLPVQQLFDELHALEIQELCVLFLAPIDSALRPTERYADWPSASTERGPAISIELENARRPTAPTLP